MSNDLIDLMREYGIEVQMLGTDEEPSPTGVALADMLTEIHTLRSRIAAERQPVPVSDEELGKIAYYAACTVDTHEDYGEPDWDALPLVDRYAQESHIVAARAVRAALRTPVPEVTDAMVDAACSRYVQYGPENARSRMRASIQAALNAARIAAKERDHE